MQNNTQITLITKNLDGGTGTFLKSLKKLPSYFNCQIQSLVLEKPSYTNSQTNQYLHPQNHYPQTYPSLLKNLKLLFQDTLWVRKKIQEQKPNLVITTDLHCNLLAILAKKTLPQNPKLLLTNHNNLPHTLTHKTSKLTKNLIFKSIKLLYNQADYLIFVSKQMEKDFISNFPLKIPHQTIQNGTNLEPLKKPKSLPKNPQIISLTRFSPQKDFQTLIQAFKLIHEKLPQTKLVLAGNGPEKQKIKRLTQKHLSKNSYQIKPWQQNPKNLLKQSHLFILSTHREGFPYSPIEAMSQALPVILTNVNYGPKELLQENEKYGLLIPPQSPNKLAKKAISLLTNKKRYAHYSKMSLKRAKNFQEQRMLKKYTKTIKKILEK